MKRSVRIQLSRLVIACWVFAALAGIVSAQQTPALRSITYRLTMSRPASHMCEVRIEVEFADAAKVESLDFQMPKWSPGRYAVFDFEKNVQEVHTLVGVEPKNAVEAPLRAKLIPLSVPITRIDDQTWRVQTLGNLGLTFSYKVFANDLSGTFSQLDTRHANYNGGSIFMYILCHTQSTVPLSVNPPAR